MKVGGRSFTGMTLGGHIEGPLDEVQEEDGKGDDFHDRDGPLLDASEGEGREDQQEDDAPFDDFVDEAQLVGSSKPFQSLRGAGVRLCGRRENRGAVPLLIRKTKALKPIPALCLRLGIVFHGFQCGDRPAFDDGLGDGGDHGLSPFPAYHIGGEGHGLG